MSRQRYVKLVMSLGYGRNIANKSALSTIRRGQKYADKWGMISTYHADNPKNQRVLFRDGFWNNGRRCGL